MPTFAVPFVPTPGFAEAVSDRREAVHSLYAPLGEPSGLDARLTLHRWDTDRLVDTLGAVRGIPVYALVNGRWIHPRQYMDQKALAEFCLILERLLIHAGLTGLVFADQYFLSALGAAAPDIACRLEAVPSINFMLDTLPKVRSVISAIARTPFMQPAHLILDRSLNRDMDALKKLSAAIRSQYPGMRIGLLANEGCLYHCPFKGAHDALIAMAQQQPAGDLLHRMNRDFGCLAHLARNPAEILKSPFIRPEDVDSYAGPAQFIKLCGRTLGEAFLVSTMDAYIGRRFDGNLLDIMDTPAALRDRLHIANGDFPAHFLETVTGCDKACAACGFCESVFTDIGRWQNAPLQHLRDTQVIAQSLGQKHH